MEMPGLQSEHRKLQAMVGSWSGAETLVPSPWDPRGGEARGRLEAHLALDGFFVFSDYVEERDGRVLYRGRGVYGWNAAERCYTMYWFDSMGAGPAAPARGSWEGDTLCFETRSPMGRSHYVYTFEAEGRYRFRIESAPDDGPWVTYMDATYVRA